MLTFLVFQVESGKILVGQTNLKPESNSTIRLPVINRSIINNLQHRAIADAKAAFDERISNDF